MARAWKPLEEMTPFARMLAEYMTRRWPPMTAPEFAELTHISVQSVYNYLLKDVVPRGETIDQIAQATSLAREELYRAAGIPLPGQVDWRDAQRRVEGLDVPEVVRADLLRCLDEVRAKYEATAASRG